MTTTSQPFATPRPHARNTTATPHLRNRSAGSIPYLRARNEIANSHRRDQGKVAMLHAGAKDEALAPRSYVRGKNLPPRPYGQGEALSSGTSTQGEILATGTSTQGEILATGTLTQDKGRGDYSNFSRYDAQGGTTVRYAHAAPDRSVRFTSDPFPSPQPFRHGARSIRRAMPPISPKSTVGIVAMVAALALAVCAIGLALTLANASASVEGEPTTSTPKREWKAGQVPYLYQTDPAWASYAYAGDTVGTSGCGPTCLSMVYVAITGKTDRDPASMSAFSQINGYVADGQTSWLLMSEGAAKLGLSSIEVPADAAALREALASGHPVIASVAPGDFTTTGHFIVIAGVDETGNLDIHDPNSAERSNMTWDIERVLGQCRNLWAFSA